MSLKKKGATCRWRLDKLQWCFKLIWGGRWSSFHVKGTNYMLVAGLNLEITGTPGMCASLCVCCKTLQQPEDRNAGSDTRQIPPTCITRNRRAIFFSFALPQIQVTSGFWRAAFTRYISATTWFCLVLANFQDYYGLCQYTNELLALQLRALWLANKRQKCYQAA